MLKDVTTSKTYETKREAEERANPPETAYQREMREIFEALPDTPETDGFIDSFIEFCERDGKMTKDEINQSIVRHTCERMGGPKRIK